MHDGYIAKPLGCRQIDQAFPVVHTIAPDLPVERWRAFAAALIGSHTPVISSRDGADAAHALSESGTVAPTGIMTVQNERGYIHGLFSYAVEEHLRHGRILNADNVIVLDLLDVAGVAGALLRAMDTLARALGCSAIHTNLPENYSSLPDYCTSLLNYFRDEGHAVETLRLCKHLDGANDNAAAPALARVEEAE